MGSGEQGKSRQELGSNAQSGLGMLFLLRDRANLPCVGLHFHAQSRPCLPLCISALLGFAALIQ